MIEARQIRAARALLDWTRDDLAKASGLSVPALTQIEGEHRMARTSSMDKIRAALEAAGVVFTDNMGVKMRSEIVTIYEGQEGYRRYCDDNYFIASSVGGEFLMAGGFQRDFQSAIDSEFYEFHTKRMAQVAGFRVRALKPVSEAQRSYPPYIECRLLPDESFFTVPFYLYGPKLAIILWHPTLRVIVMQDAGLIDAYHKQFELFWKMARRLPAATQTAQEGVDA